MRSLLIAAAAAGMLFAAPALATQAPSTPAATQATADQQTAQDFSARRHYHYRYWHHRHYRHYGWYRGHHECIDPAKVLDVARWRESDAYDETERLVLQFAESASDTPAAVEPDVVAKLTERLGEKAVVELAAWVALEHFRSRFNASLGLHSQGFSESCAVPASVLKVAG